MHCQVKARRAQVDKLLRDAAQVTTLSQEDANFQWLYREREACYDRIKELSV